MGSAQLYRDNDHIEQTINKYGNSRRADVVLDVSFESRNNTISDREDLEEEKNHFMNNIQTDRASQDEAGDIKVPLKPEQKTPLAQIIYKHGQYWIYNKLYYDKDEDFTLNPENQIWLTMREFKDSASSFGYAIKEGDILKFGRARLKVIKIYLPKLAIKPTESKLKLTEKVKQCELASMDIPHCEYDTENGQEQATCRICFIEGEDKNPLISVCKCSGSMKFIHLECLKGWIDSKKTVKSTISSVTYTWKAYECELCKSSYSCTLQDRYGLLKYENPFSEYIIFEGLHTNNTKTVYVINTDNEKEEMKIGRGQDSDIRISDISVSRFHASIRRQGDKFILKDNNSKFGTLACLKKPLCLSNFPSVHLQVGRTLMQVYLKEKKDWSLNGCLWLPKDTTVLKNNKNPLLNSTEISEEMIPREFKRHLKKVPYPKDTLIKKPKSPQIKRPLQDSPPREKVELNINFLEDMEVIKQKQYSES